MKQINKDDYASYTIVGAGWSLTIHDFNVALRQWKDMTYGALYGNKFDGTRVIIDEK